MLGPGTTYMLILGFKITDAEKVGHRTALEVSYESGGENYRATLRAGLVTCRSR